MLPLPLLFARISHIPRTLARLQAAKNLHFLQEAQAATTAVTTSKETITAVITSKEMIIVVTTSKRTITVVILSR